MKKAKVAKKTDKKTDKKVAKVAKAAPTKKVEAKKAEKLAVVAKKSKAPIPTKPVALTKVAAQPAKVEKVVKTEKVMKESKKALKTELNNKQAETSKFVNSIIDEQPAKPRTLREALSGTIKKASEMEPDAILHVDEAKEKTDAEKKAFFRKIAAAGTNFDSVYKLAKALKTKNYKMNDIFEAKTPIMHKVLGWGFILACANNRIQVLFKEGVKTLVINYQQK